MRSIEHALNQVEGNKRIFEHENYSFLQNKNNKNEKIPTRNLVLPHALPLNNHRLTLTFGYDFPPTHHPYTNWEKLTAASCITIR